MDISLLPVIINYNYTGIADFQINVFQ